MFRLLPRDVVKVIATEYPQLHGDGCIPYTQADRAAGIVAAIDSVPPDLITLSLTTSRSLSSSMPRSCDSPFVLGTAATEDGKRTQRVSSSSATLWRNARTQCPILPLMASVITDPDFREALRLDVSSADRSLRDGEWKAATVLAGSAVDALLLSALDGRRGDAVNAAAKLAASGVL
jgi:hypothetical protein